MAKKTINVLGDTQREQWHREYREAERGRFDAYLLRDGVPIAYTDYDVVRICTDTYDDGDKPAVKEFAESYELPVSFFYGIIEEDF